MLITSNRSVAEWGTVFGVPVVAAAIHGRLLHHRHVLTIRGDSCRLRAKRKSALIKALAADGLRSARLPPFRQRRGQPSIDTMNPGWGSSA